MDDNLGCAVMIIAFFMGVAAVVDAVMAGSPTHKALLIEREKTRQLEIKSRINHDKK